MNDADIAVGTTAFQDAADIDGEWAVAGYDVRHKLALVGLWELPFFNKGSGPTRALLGGWQLAGSAIFQTGTPINVTNSAAFPTGDYNADGNGGDRPNAPAGTVKQSGWSQEEYLAGIFQASDFPKPAPGQNGNLARNAFRGPGLHRRQPVALEEVQPVEQAQRGVPRRRVQRAEQREPIGPGYGSEQHELRPIDVAAEYQGRSTGYACAVLAKATKRCINPAVHLCCGRRGGAFQARPGGV